MEDELELWHSVQYRMDEEGIDYCFKHYSNWDEIKDEEFHRLRLDFLISMKELREYVSKSIIDCEDKIEKLNDLEDEN